jgi:dephospho-CoA kinase
VVRALRAGDPSGVYLHFDSIGVPDHETMVREFGSGERWQAEMTRRWVARIAAEYAASLLVVLEGQARPSFVEEALTESGIARSAIILVHCDDEEREARLAARGQPALANTTMRSWAAFMRREAQARRLVVIDTTRGAVAEAASSVLDVARGLLGRTV